MKQYELMPPRSFHEPMADDEGGVDHHEMLAPHGILRTDPDLLWAEMMLDLPTLCSALDLKRAMLRSQGLQYTEIAVLEGCSQATAEQAVSAIKQSVYRARRAVVRYLSCLGYCDEYEGKIGSTCYFCGFGRRNSNSRKMRVGAVGKQAPTLSNQP